MDENNNSHIFLKVWYLYYRWAGIWKVHRIGMRISNHDLQWDTLAAAAPLFPNAAKSNYTTTIAQYLFFLKKFSILNEKLQHIGSFKISNSSNNNIENENSKNVCFGFDEALETFGVRFIKQNITSNIIDNTTLKTNIKAVQTEKERIDLLLNKYLEDTTISRSS